MSPTSKLPTDCGGLQGIAFLWMDAVKAVGAFRTSKFSASQLAMALRRHGVLAWGCISPRPFLGQIHVGESPPRIQ